MSAAMMSEASMPPPASTARGSSGGAASVPSGLPVLPVPPVRFLGARPTEASLAAELAQERHITLELQRAILPLHDTPFDLPGLRTVVRYLPASQASRVGGDWYITAEMPDGNVLLAIGDVGGHGLEAAAGMARLRGALAGLAITGAPPDRLLLTWAQAGHPPPVLVRGAWAMPIESPSGILLGAGKGTYEVNRLWLQ